MANSRFSHNVSWCIVASFSLQRQHLLFWSLYICALHGRDIGFLSPHKKCLNVHRIFLFLRFHCLLIVMFLCVMLVSFVMGICTVIIYIMLFVSLVSLGC